MRPQLYPTLFLFCRKNSPTKSHFETLSAVLAGKPELRQALIFSAVIDAALDRLKLYQKKTILFVKGVAEVQTRYVEQAALKLLVAVVNGALQLPLRCGPNSSLAQIEMLKFAPLSRAAR